MVETMAAWALDLPPPARAFLAVIGLGLLCSFGFELLIRWRGRT